MVEDLIDLKTDKKKYYRKIMKSYSVFTQVIAIVTLAYVQRVCMPMPLEVLRIVEDKRQGLIPFPRVGRTIPSPYFLSNYFDQREISEPDMTSDALNGANDVFLRYTRKDRAFTPRLGRRKRAIADNKKDEDRKPYKVIELNQQ